METQRTRPVAPDLCRLRDQISIDPRPALRQQFRWIAVLISIGKTNTELL